MRATIATVLVILFLTGAAFGQELSDWPTTGKGASPAAPDGPPAGARGGPPPGAMPTGPVVGFALGGGAVHQAVSDLEDAGDFSVNRFFIQPGLDVFFSRDLQMSFKLGYGYDAYDFGGDIDKEPWGDVETLRFSVFTRYVIDERWSLFGVPAIQFAAERGASFSDGFTFGLYAGALWKASETFSIGPGAGFFSEIEDSIVVFPFLLIEWQLAENWSIRTGRGLAATRGPGLVLEWKFADQWALSLGGRWEQLRFRLDDDKIAPDGVGEEESIPVFLGLTYLVAPRSSISLLGGVNFYGRLSLYDEDGDRITREDYDPAPFLGLAFSLTF